MIVYKRNSIFLIKCILILLAILLITSFTNANDIESLKNEIPQQTQQAQQQETILKEASIQVENKSKGKSNNKKEKKEKKGLTKHFVVSKKNADFDALENIVIETIEPSTNSKQNSNHDLKDGASSNSNLKSASSTQASPTEKKPIFVWRHQDHFHYEIFFGVYILFVIWIFIRGRKQNQEIADKISKRYSELYKNQFHTAKDNGLEFYRQSTSNFFSYVSGRNHCYGLVTDLILKYRQDSLYTLYDWFVGAGPDKLVLSVSLIEMKPFVLAILKKSDRISYVEDNEDLKNLQSVELSIPGNDFVQLTDTPHVANELLKSGLLDLLKKSGHLVQKIHISDLSKILYADSEKTYNIRFEFNLPQKESDWAHLDKLVSFVFEFIDTVSKLNVPENIVHDTLNWRVSRPKDGTRNAKPIKQKKQKKVDDLRKPKK